MLERYAQDFYELGAGLTTLAEAVHPTALDIQADGATDADRAAAALTILRDIFLPSAKKRCQALGMRNTLKAMERHAKWANEKTVATFAELTQIHKDLDWRIRDELSDCVMFFVSEDKARHYDDFRNGWEFAVMKFPISDDVEEAEKCFSLGRNTACVFHLMRVAETGVQATGAHFHLPPETLKEAWGNIVNALDGVVKKIPDKTERAKWALIVDDLFHLNLALRVPTMHPRGDIGTYNEEQASDILVRVKALMRHLAETI